MPRLMVGQRKVQAPPGEGGVSISGAASEPSVPQGPEGEVVVCPECSCEFVPEPAAEQSGEASDLAAVLASQMGGE